MIKIDALRTRNSLFDEGNKEYLILLLTFYCKRKGISYKQGLNEVLAPFVYFRNSNLTLSKIFNYFSIFVDKYLINFYVDEVKPFIITIFIIKIIKYHKEFITIQICFQFFNLLMKYHDPYLCHYLEINMISPEIYAFPWFLTLFAKYFFLFRLILN